MNSLRESNAIIIISTDMYTRYVSHDRSIYRSLTKSENLRLSRPMYIHVFSDVDAREEESSFERLIGRLSRATLSRIRAPWAGAFS